MGSFGSMPPNKGKAKTESWPKSGQTIVAAHLVNRKYPRKSVPVLDTPSHPILILVMVDVKYLINELFFEFALTIEDLRQSAYPNLINPWLPPASFDGEYP